jgi:hypothetical protein
MMKQNDEAAREALPRWLTFQRYWQKLKADIKVLSSNANMQV